jgi:hypothetical protein
MFEPSKLSAMLQKLEDQASTENSLLRPVVDEPASWQPYETFYTHLSRFPQRARPFSIDSLSNPLSNAHLWLLSPGTFHPQARVRKCCAEVLPQCPQVALASDLWTSISHFFLGGWC